MFLLKAHRPKKYRDSLANQLKDDTPEEEDVLTRLQKEIDGRSRGLPDRLEPIEPGGPSFVWDSVANRAKASTDAPNGALADKSADGTEDKSEDKTAESWTDPPSPLTGLRSAGKKAVSDDPAGGPPSPTDRRASGGGPGPLPFGRTRKVGIDTKIVRRILEEQSMDNFIKVLEKGGVL